MYLQLYTILIIYVVSPNVIDAQDFFQAQLSPLILTSVPYLDGEVAVYEHKQNNSRLFVPPLATLYLNQTRVIYNPLLKSNVLRLSLILYTNELRETILNYLSSSKNRCNSIYEKCDIKMVPIERLRIIWKRTDHFASDYKLDTSWLSNTALLNKIDVHIRCLTNETCSTLKKSVLETPEILNGLELEYSTRTEKQTRKLVTITGQHVMKTQMYSELKQLPSSTVDSNIRYLFIDDMNQFITEIFTTVELEEIKDSDYMAHDDQKALKELLRQSLSSNLETLSDHSEQQWNLVYWKFDSIRPDRIIHLLNDELKQLQNRTTDTDKNTKSKISVGDQDNKVLNNISDSEANKRRSTISRSRSNYEIHEWCDAISKYSNPKHSRNTLCRKTHTITDGLSLCNEQNWYHIASLDRQATNSDSEAEQDEQSFQDLRQKNFDFYTNNHQFIEFTGEKFVAKPVKAYKVNLAFFQGHTKFVHKSIIVSHMELIHAVPIRILSLSSDAVITTVPVTDACTNVFQWKLLELNRTLNLNFELAMHQLNKQLAELRSSITASETISKNLENQMNKQYTELTSIITTMNNRLSSHLNEHRLPLPTSLVDIHPNTTWSTNGITVAGGNGLGSGINQLYWPWGLYIDDNDTIYVADYYNHRIVEWKPGATNGTVVAGGNGQGNGAHQLYNPYDVIMDKTSDSLIISDNGNRRVVRWPRRNGTRGETMISNIGCIGLTMDDNGYLYVVDNEKHEVRQYKMGETQGTVVAGGNGQGNRLDQLSYPRYVFVNRNHSVYVSEYGNHRVMKWKEGAKQGIVVAGHQGHGNSLVQLNYPYGVVVDQLGTVYVADCHNHRIMRWSKGTIQGSVIIGRNGKGAESNQLDSPVDLSFDRYEHARAKELREKAGSNDLAQINVTENGGKLL
ncbi:unnamed protein product [Rotaria sp. Silwood1]|nr:unnamed protein product [Rotaria sp. Silwood1]CAF1635101.1 unnamed protein product [Rotaria sp. Silwood1]